MNPADVRQTIRSWLLRELLPGENPENLSDDLNLRDAGVLDSLSTVQLVDLLEDRFGIEVGFEETGAGNFATINRLVEYVSGKVGADGDWPSHGACLPSSQHDKESE